DLRLRVLNDTDVRIDAILVGHATIPLRLRDLVAQTGGSVQSGVDLDEVGALAQRLENEAASGSWVTIPQKGYVDLSTRKAIGVGGGARHTDRRGERKPLSVKPLQELYKGGARPP